MTNPTKRSTAVQIPPPATWVSINAQVEFDAIENITSTRAAAAIGKPLSGTI
ncbi:MAG: hypothetical protein IPI82_03725 [Candidatus Microthrix sp.]|nr:hypothetical protein [Candidatus Microthrix sp.]MBK7321578.1 hypothetical protein [Candidatus Microthrix sp.]